MQLPLGHTFAQRSSVDGTVPYILAYVKLTETSIQRVERFCRVSRVAGWHSHIATIQEQATHQPTYINELRECVRSTLSVSCPILPSIQII